MGDDRDIDALFQLSLTEFTQARNALASRLKREGQVDDAASVKALVKPSISAWAVNQLYWKHRAFFINLTSAGQRLVQAQASQFAGKAADISRAQAERREALSTLSRLADALLRADGHQATPDTMRRVNATLEVLSTCSSGSDTPRFGRLTEDLNPAGFESIAALIPVAAEQPIRSTRVVPFKPRTKHGAEAEEDPQIESMRAALHSAEEALKVARSTAEALAAAREKAVAEAEQTETHRLQAEEQYEAARLAEQEARRRLKHVTAEQEKAAKTVEDAARDVDKARADLKRRQRS